MKVLVLLKEVADLRILTELESGTGRVRSDWEVRRLCPADEMALAAALELKSAGETTVSLAYLGPEDGDRWLRQGLAQGADEVIRVWDEGLDRLHPPARALVCAALVDVLAADLVLVGEACQDAAASQLGLLVAARLSLPCVTGVTELTWVREETAFMLTRTLDHGGRERVWADIPLVVTAQQQEGIPPQPVPLPAVLAAEESPIPVWDLAEIGVPWDYLWRTERALQYGALRFPKPRLRPTKAPDSCLPAFDRIRCLVEGGTQVREGRVRQGSDRDLAAALFNQLQSEGWLDHLRVPASS